MFSFGLFAAKPVVAVWEIDNKTLGKNKLSKYDAELIADLMRDELVQSQEFTVMSKDDMESAIAKHVKKSHQLNKDKNYAIELGRQISARFVVTSWIKNDGKSFRMFAEITDTETATTTHSGRAKFVMDDDSKDIAVASLIRQLLGEREETLRPKKSDDQVACEKARSSREPAGWIAYKKRYPNGICIEEADMELDRMGCELAKSQNTIEGWEGYLKRHPNGICYFDADTAILKLKRQRNSGRGANSGSNQVFVASNSYNSRDINACKYAREEDSVEAWEMYLEKFPEGECAFEAEAKIRKVKKGGVVTEEDDYSSKTCVQKYKQAAEQGQVHAQTALGNCYYNGDGTARDYYKAFIWYKKAAEQGQAYAQTSIGNCYYNGEGVEQDYYAAFG